MISKVAIIGKGALGLLYGTLISQALGHDSVEYVMDDAHFERHCNDEITVNGSLCTIKTVPEQKARIAQSCFELHSSQRILFNTL